MKDPCGDHRREDEDGGYGAMSYVSEMDHGADLHGRVKNFDEHDDGKIESEANNSAWLNGDYVSGPRRG